MKSAVPDWAETGLNEAAASWAAAWLRRARSSWMVDESERETSSARVSTAATGAGKGCVHAREGSALRAGALSSSS